MTKFLNDTGLTRLVALIKQAINGKADKTELPLVVNFTESNDVWTCDTSIADIYAAYSADREVVGHISSDGQVNLFVCTENTVLFYWIFSDAVNYIIGNTANDVDSWTHIIEYIQEKLTFDNAPTANSNNPVKSGGIKTALDGKQDKDFIITLSINNGVYTADKSFSEVLAAYNAGKTPVVLYYEYICYFVSYDESDFHFINHPYDELSVLYQATLHSNNTWEYSGLGLQEELIFDNTPTANSTKPVTSSGIKSALDGKQDTLVSGTNIKTVNSQTLLGSGDILLNAATIGTSPSGNYDGDPIEEVLDEKQDSLVSGTNIKTVNNNSLLGSGDVHFDGGNLVYSGNETYELVAGETIDQNLDRIDGLIHDLGTPNEIASITTSESSASGGNNTVTITETNGTTTTFNVKNGIDGQDGQDGADGVSLGEIALVQTTGDATDAVMSQNAVTEYGRKLLYIEDFDGTTDNVRSFLTSEGWKIGYKLSSTNQETVDNTCCITSYIPVSEISGHSITFSYRLSADNNKCLCLYKSDKSYPTNWYYSQSPTNARTVTISSSVAATAYIRMTCNINDLINCYIYDNTTQEYLFKGDDYIKNILKSSNVTFNYLDSVITQDAGTSINKIMSQNIVTKLFAETIYNNKIPSYFAGTALHYNPSNYPSLDPRTCDGISLLIINRTSLGSQRTCLLKFNATGYSDSAKIYNIGMYFDSLVAGFTNGHHQYVTYGGVKQAISSGVHMIITLEFKTGEVKWYKNGVLQNTYQPNEAYNYEDVVDCFSKVTTIDMGWPSAYSGMALFGHILTDSEVSAIYDSGCESAINVTVPIAYEANRIAPQIYNNNWTLLGTGFTSSRDENGLTLTFTSGSFKFGFAGLSGAIHYVIYEWSFEVLSGSATTYSRGMIYGNNYYKIFTMLDEENNDVSYDGTITAGHTYTVVAKPDTYSFGINSTTVNDKCYIFTPTSDFVMRINPILKITERGAGIIVDTKNYRGTYWDLVGGIQLPCSTVATYGGWSAVTPFYDTFKPSTRTYSSSAAVQFTGQTAVDTTNGKIYMGYLTGTGGTWKQINNS